MKSNYNTWFIYGLALGSFFVFILSLNIYKVGDGWLGFWGGIIGSGLGVVGAFFVLNKQIKQDNAEIEKAKVDTTFFTLLDMHIRLKEKIKSEGVFINYYADLQKYITFKLREIGTKKILNDPSVTKNLEDLYLSYIEEIRMKLKSRNIDVNEIHEDNHQKLGYLMNQMSLYFSPKTSNDLEEFKFISVDLSEAARKILPLIDQIRGGIYNSNYSYLLMKKLLEIYKTAEKTNIGEKPRMALRSLIEEISKYESEDDQTLIYLKEDKEAIVNSVSDIYYSKLVSYFRLTHRIIKYINDNVDGLTEKNEYLGFFRSTIDETEMLIIFYNSYFSKRGEGLGRQISKTAFFGESGELGENNGFVLHFNPEKLLWPEEDLKIMRTIKY